MAFARPQPIVVAIPSFQPGGTERQMIELVRRLDPARWTVHLACFTTAGEWFGRAAERVASVGEFPISSFRKPATFRQMRRFARWCQERSAVLVHTSDLYTNIFFLPAAAIGGVPVRIGSRREIAACKSAAQIGVQRVAYAFAHRVVANAQAVADRLVRERVAPARITVVPNGLDLTRFVPRVDAPAGRRIAMVANLRPAKGHDALIAAAPAILERFPDATFDLIGGGTEREALERLVADAGVQHAFTFAGHVEDVPHRLSEADVFTLPSESEAFPNAVLEAMAASLPVVATGVGGIREVVRDGRTGLLVPPRNPRALAEAICSLLADPVRAQRLAAAGRTLVETRYSFDQMVTSIDQVYDDELARRAPDRLVQSQFASL